MLRDALVEVRAQLGHHLANGGGGIDARAGPDHTGHLHRSGEGLIVAGFQFKDDRRNAATLRQNRHVRHIDVGVHDADAAILGINRT